MENQGVPRVIVFVLLGVISLFIFGSQMFITIDPGQNGVLFKRFGGGLDKEQIYGQGFHVLAPWNKMIVYETPACTEVDTMDDFEYLEYELERKESKILNWLNKNVS